MKGWTQRQYREAAEKKKRPWNRERSALWRGFTFVADESVARLTPEELSEKLFGSK